MRGREEREEREEELGDGLVGAVGECKWGGTGKAVSLERGVKEGSGCWGTADIEGCSVRC